MLNSIARGFSIVGDIAGGRGGGGGGEVKRGNPRGELPGLPEPRRT